MARVLPIAARTNRHRELKELLEGRRRELRAEMQGKMRDVRVAGEATKLVEVCDAGERSGNDINEDIEFALIQLKAATLDKIDQALRRLEQGAYGNCFDCGDEIAEKRLRALPFAVRCKDCDEALENAEREERQRAAGPRRPKSLFDL